MTRPASAARLARYGLTLRDAVGLGLWDEDAQAPADPGAADLLSALSRVADPDLALRQLHRVVERDRPSCSASSQTSRPVTVVDHSSSAASPASGCKLMLALREDPGLRRRLVAVLGASSALGDHLVANPAEWQALATGDDGLGPAADGVLVVGDEPSVADLRRAYRRSLLRIAAADLTGARGLEQTMAALSALADATLAAAYRVAVNELPGTDEEHQPRLAVVAMGKCGGGELNYVSDVDVIFIAGSDADLPAATTVATRLIEICEQVAWTVDAALRPEGGRGPLVRTLASHLAYYRRWARTWEFQALLKARPATGDIELAREWLAELRPLVWHAAERPEAVEDVRAMRRRIVDNVPPGELAREIKRGPGGLRDIEFAVQLLQLVHGRGDESLREAGTLPALRALVSGGYVGRADGEALLRAYHFLRSVEHRLQLRSLRRTHLVPEDPDELRCLAQAMGYSSGPQSDAVEAFRADWVAHAAEVRRLHAKLLYRPLLEAVARVPAESLRLTPEEAKKRLELLGFADPQGALRHLQALTGGVSRTAAIQRTLLPVLLAEFADAPEPDRGLLAYRQVSDKLGSTPWYLRLLRDEGPVALRLARQLGLSRYVSDLLAREPESLRLLADDAELTPRPAGVLRDGFAAAAARHLEPSGEPGAAAPEAAIAAVRALRRRELFRVAAADVLTRSDGLAPPHPLDIAAVGDALSDLTDATLAAALASALAAVAATPAGQAVMPAGPGGVPDGQAAPRLRFAVIGMGRLGGREMSYSSDADVLFVYEPPPGVPEDVASGAAHAIAEEMRRLLALPAPDPPLGVDADLRPEGRQGPLVRSLAAYVQYYARWSKVWEAQALLRARFVCGDAGLGERFLALANRVRYPSGGLTREQVTEIRRIKARVETERLPRGADYATHTKLGRGGLSDVEWTAQLLQLRHAHGVPALRTTRTLDALAAARDSGLIRPADAAALAAGWTLASRVRNALTLVRGRASDQVPRHGPELAGVAHLLATWHSDQNGPGPAGPPDSGRFLDEYLRTTRRSRSAMERVFND